VSDSHYYSNVTCRDKVRNCPAIRF